MAADLDPPVTPIGMQGGATVVLWQGAKKAAVRSGCAGARAERTVELDTPIAGLITLF